jgi:hypothetical protein
MTKRSLPLTILAITLALASLSCGGSQESNRLLQSVTLSPATATAAPGGQVQFTATGSYSASPYTSTPPSYTQWGVCYQGSPTTEVTVSSAGVAQCGSSASGTYSVFAQAPSNSQGPVCNAILACGGGCDLVAGDAQLTCGK